MLNMSIFCSFRRKIIYMNLLSPNLYASEKLSIFTETLSTYILILAKFLQ